MSDPKGQGQAAQAPAQQTNMPQADDQTNQMIANYQKMQQSGIFQTPYQRAMQQHPIGMGIANAMQAFGQGVTKQPFYTANQEAQAGLQNTQLQGINAINTLPAQLRMMMAMQGMYNNGGNQQPPSNIPGVPSQGNPLQAQINQALQAGYSQQEIQAYLAGKK